MFAIQPVEETETIREPVWQDLARCNDGSGSMTELFFSEQLDDIAAAKAFCLECPVTDNCLDGALDAARAVGRVGRRAVRARQDRRPEAQAWPSAEGPSGGARGAERLTARLPPRRTGRDNERELNPPAAHKRVPACAAA